MLEKLVWGTYRKSDYKARQRFTKEAERMIREYGWQEMTVHPYSYPVKVTKIIEEFKAFDICTSGTKEYLIQLVNGLAEIMNKWEEYELQPKIRVRFKNGKEKELREELARDMMEEGLCEAV